jgi:DNA-binding XRE family transcriptional regulator
VVIRMAGVYHTPLRELAKSCRLILDPLLNPTNWTPGRLPHVIPVLREAVGLSRAELARTIGTSPRTLAKWEAGRAHPDVEQEKRLASALGLGERELAVLRPMRPSRTPMPTAYH